MGKGHWTFYTHSASPPSPATAEVSAPAPPPHSFPRTKTPLLALDTTHLVDSDWVVTMLASASLLVMTWLWR